MRRAGAFCHPPAVRPPPGLVLCALLLSCGNPTPPRPTAAIQLPRAPPAPPPAPAAPPAPDLSAALRAALCADRSPCHVLRDRPAGQDPAGRRLSVVSVWAGQVRSDEEEGTTGEAPEPEGALPADIHLEQGEREDTTSANFGGCHRIEYWLVARRGEIIDAATPLLRLCNDGHGAASVGEDTVTIGDGSLTHATAGGSSWRWSETREISLAPLRIRRTASNGWWNMSSNVENTEWSWDDFAGKTTWYSPPCNANGQPDFPSDSQDVGPGDRGGVEYSYAALPMVEIDEPFASSGWKTAGLGRCALSLDAAGERGFVVHGKPGERSDAALRVVASARGVLYIEVEDDRLVGPSPRWVRDDHLEIWLAKDLPGYMAHCLDKVDPPEQWGIRIADGKVFAGAEQPDPAALTVERVAASHAAGPTRFKIGLPPGHQAVTVVYSDSDDGRKQERLLATSKLTHGNPFTLGAFTRLPPERVTCRVEGGRLEPVEKPVDPARFADDL